MKSQTLKKTIGLLAVALLASTALIGCGKSASKSSQGNDKAVTFWVNCSDETPEGKAWDKIGDKFNAENGKGYQVKIEYIPRSGSGGGYEDKVNAAITTNTLPDIISLDGPNTAAYASSKVIAPLDDYLADANMDDVLDSIKQQGTYDGKFYAFGFSESGVGVYYNKKMFQEAGIDLTTLPTLEKPWTWTEFQEICATIKDKFKSPAIDIQLENADEMLTYAYTPFIWSNGGDVVDETGTKAKNYSLFKI